MFIGVLQLRASEVRLREVWWVVTKFGRTVFLYFQCRNLLFMACLMILIQSQILFTVNVCSSLRIKGLLHNDYIISGYKLYQ
jgi:hypothetical protein